MSPNAKKTNDGLSDDNDFEEEDDKSDAPPTTKIMETQDDAAGAEVQALSTKPRPRAYRKSQAGRKIKANSPAMPPLSTESSSANSPQLRFDQDSVTLLTHCIEATNDIAPVFHGPKPRPFMYWQLHKDYFCAMLLIRRYPELVDIAEKHYSSVKLMAKRWAGIVRTKANNERAIQIRYLKNIWLSNSSRFSLAFNALDTKINENDEAEITLSPAVKASGLNSIAELRELLRSPVMYKNATVFDLFCLGIESGQLKMARTTAPTRLQKLITIAHEAHFRLELWFALSKQGFRHKTTSAWNDKRKDYWDEFCKLVAKDRRDNEETASTDRLGEQTEPNLDGSDDDDENGGVDPEYF